MDGAKNLIEALTALLWPLIVVILIFFFRPAVSAIMESAKSRKFTLKIGGQELTMDEASQVQQKLIADLQTQVSEIQKKLGGLVTQTVQSATLSSHAPSKILWVDDNPKNNSYFIQQLSDMGVKVDTALSTAEGLSLFNSHKYDCIISDMGRTEGLSYHPTAGIKLLEQIRNEDKNIAFLIYSSALAGQNYGRQALERGATAVTSSPTELFGLLNLGSMQKRAAAA
jgi:CheY-like chemotaxis protein